MNYYGPYSHSRIQTYYKCPARFKYDYVDRLPAPIGLPPSPQMERGTDIHKTVEDFMHRRVDVLHPDIHEAYGAFFHGLRESYQVFPEHPFAVDKDFAPVSPDAENVWFRGFFDLKLLPKEGPVSELVIYEFKSGNIYEQEHGDQRDRYAVMGLIQHPEAESVVVWGTYLDKLEVRATRLARQNLYLYKEILQGEIKRMEKDEFFMTRPGYGCRWCNRSRYNGGPCQF